MGKGEVFGQLWEFLKYRKKFWLAPIIFLMVLIGFLLLVAPKSVIAPIIYTLFCRPPASRPRRMGILEVRDDAGRSHSGGVSLPPLRGRAAGAGAGGVPALPCRRLPLVRPEVPLAARRRG